MRLFERAFARPAKLLTHPLAAFLHPRFGYDEAELGKWFDELRDPATHADARKEVLLERDVRPVIDRMERAAFDVLLNKADMARPVPGPARDLGPDSRAPSTRTGASSSSRTPRR